MSLELAITANTAAILALTEAWSAHTRNAINLDGATASVAKLVKEAAPAAKSQPVEAAPVAEVVAEAIDYPTVGAAIIAYAVAHGRDAARTKLSQLNVDSGKALAPEQYAEALALFTAEEAVTS